MLHPLLTQNLHPHAVKIRLTASLGSLLSLAKKAPHEPLISFIPFLGTKMFSYPLRGGPPLLSLLWLWALLSASKGTDRPGTPIVGHTNARTGWPLLGVIYAGWRGLRAEISPRHPKPCCLYPAVSPFFTSALCGKHSSKGLHVKSMCWSGRWEGGAAWRVTGGSWQRGGDIALRGLQLYYGLHCHPGANRIGNN